MKKEIKEIKMAIQHLKIARRSDYLTYHTPLLMVKILTRKSLSRLKNKRLERRRRKRG